MLRKIHRFLGSLLGLYAHQVMPNENHLVDRRRQWHSPRTAGGRLLNVLNKDPDFTKVMSRQRNEFTLLRIALCGDQIRVNAYRAAPDVEYGYKIFDPDWEADGVFPYLYGDGTVTLLIRDMYPDMRYNPYDPEFSWALPLTGAESIEFQGNYQAVAA